MNLRMWWMRGVVVASICTLLLPAVVLAGEAIESNHTVTVMTRNVYDGVDAEIATIVQDLMLGAPSMTLLLDAGNVLAAAKTRDFPSRAALIANEVAAANPDLIAVEEATLWRTQCPADFAAGNADHVEIDYLKILLDALAAKGLIYEVAGVSIGLDAELPAITAEGLCDVRMTDRDVILVRSGGQASRIKISNVQSGQYSIVCARVVSYPRGWVSVDVRTSGRPFRFIATHLETEDCAGDQLGQAIELLAGPAKRDLPVVMAGDFNSDANSGPTATPAYPAMITAGFRDAWKEVNEDDPGLTCCQAPDLLNSVPFSLQQERIDLVLLRGEIGVKSVIRLGGSERTAAGLWPSDHAGVAATLSINRIEE